MPRMPPINRGPFQTPNARAVSLAPHPRTGQPDTAIARARVLRADATDAERMLWASLRLLKAQGFHFRRQSRVGSYIADFACKGSRLVVELDGAQHGEADSAAYDRVRTAYLESRGYRVLRFWNDEVFRNREGVVESILRALVPTRPAARDDLPMLGR
ncbi:MAG: endonuclease domain-containing protein [Rhizomicrobium sp.]